MEAMGDSVQLAPLISERKDWSSLVQRWWQGGVLLLLLTWLYGSILWRLGKQWLNDPNFSHGIFVPVFALFVVWQKRKEISEFVCAPSWTGIPILLFGLLTLVLGSLGAELFLSRASLLLVIAGLMVLYWGWPTFRAILFPWAFLLLMIPFPEIILQKVTFPLQIFASKVAAALLPLAGVPVLREGNVITLPRMPLEIVQACSGIRSLLSLVTLAIIYGYLMDNRKWMRILLAVSAVPIAIAANSLRIVATGLLVQYWDPDMAEGFYHTFQGWLIFVVSLVMLFTVHRLAQLLWPDRGGEKSQPKGVSASRSFNTSVTRNGPLRFTVAALLIATTASLLQARSRNEVFPQRDPLNSFPSDLGSWTSVDIPIDQPTLDILGPGEFLLRAYGSADELPVSLFIAYYPSQRAGEAPHTPSHCLPGAGWTPTQKSVIQLSRTDGTAFPANRYVISKAGDRQLVIYWFQAHDREVANEYLAKYYLIADAMRMNRSDGALVRLMTDMQKGESADAAQKRLMSIGSQIIPLLNNYIPR
jgi:exosortase D (VPLPA-CTERM-specific)